MPVNDHSERARGMRFVRVRMAGLIFAVLAVVGGPRCAFAETFTYTNGENFGDPIELTEDAILTIDTGTATQSGTISELDGSFGITKTGAGTLVMESEGNSYTGGTVIQQGALRMGVDYAVQYTNLVIETGATFDLDGHATELYGLAGGGTLDFGAGGYFYLHSGGNFAGALTGQGDFLYIGSDIFTLSGNSSLAGGSLGVYSGTVVSSGSSTFGGLSLYGATFEVAAGSTVIDSYVYVSDSSPVRVFVSGGGALEITDGLWIGAYSGEAGEVAVTGEGSHLKVGDIEVSFEGTGTLTLSDGGRLTVGTGNGTVQLAYWDGSEGTMNIGAASGGEATAPGIVNARRVDTEDGAGVLLFNHTGTDYYFTKDGTSSGAAVRITGATKVVVEGGVTTLTSANNSYTGGTVVTDGLLLITDVGGGVSVLGAGGVEIGVSGTLGGNGAVLGDATVAGTLAPGNSAGEMRFAGDLLLDNTAVVAMELVSLDAFDRIVVAGQLTFGGTLSISFLEGFAPSAGAEFALFGGEGVGGGYSGPEFSAITFAEAGYAGSFDYDTGVLTITAVPEPSVCALILAGLLPLAARRRGFMRKA